MIGDVSLMTAGQKYMVNLLVNSLVCHGGLESALEASIEKEAARIEEKQVGCYSNCTCCPID